VDIKGRIFKGSATWQLYEGLQLWAAESLPQWLLPWGSGSALACSLRYEPFTAFSYSGSPKTEQGGDNQARHVVLTLESGISLPEALFPVKKSQKSQKYYLLSNLQFSLGLVRTST